VAPVSPADPYNLHAPIKVYQPENIIPKLDNRWLKAGKTARHQDGFWAASCSRSRQAGQSTNSALVTS
jgi:hypothetical protein